MIVAPPNNARKSSIVKVLRVVEVSHQRVYCDAQRTRRIRFPILRSTIEITLRGNLYAAL